MEYALLRSLRILGPGLLIMMLIDLFIKYEYGCGSIFWSMNTARMILIGYLIGGVYSYITPKSVIYKHAFKGVSDAITSSILKVCNDEKINVVDAKKNWGGVSPIFYNLIDNDKSLTLKSQGVFFNGFVVTTAYNSIILSVIAILISIIFMFVIEFQYVFLIYPTLLFILGIIIWKVSIARHIRLTNEQINVIKMRFHSELKEYMEN